MKIAHFSDLHLLALEGVPPSRFLNKRLTGWVNLRLKRGSVHRSAYVRAIADEVARTGIDHVVVTGDLSNLALETEFELARSLFEGMGLDASSLTVVPGNHDVYTRGSLRARRFEKYFAPWLRGDLPDLSVDVGGARFPIVKLRGRVAVIALTSAVPRWPFVAAGELGRPQLAALDRVLSHPEVAARTPILALHHPPVHRWSRVKAHLEGLRDGDELLRLLARVGRGLVLHGHLHRRVQRVVSTQAGKLLQVGATSASLQHEEPARMAGFNVYDLDENGQARVTAMVYEPASGKFRLESVPKYV
ncbi:MAG TPA: metallophosphoesterase [Polyangiaceae bacterium]|nr:metallophosphoesterase [Polyangiaceae bacterium]